MYWVGGEGGRTEELKNNGEKTDDEWEGRRREWWWGWWISYSGSKGGRDKTHRRGKYINTTPASHRINAPCNCYPKRRNFVSSLPDEAGRFSNCKRTQTFLLVGRHLERGCKTLGGPAKGRKHGTKQCKRRENRKRAKTGGAVKLRLDWDLQSKKISTKQICE